MAFDTALLKFYGRLKEVTNKLTEKTTPEQRNYFCYTHLLIQREAWDYFQRLGYSGVHKDKCAYISADCCATNAKLTSVTDLEGK